MSQGGTLCPNEGPKIAKTNSQGGPRNVGEQILRDNVPLRQHSLIAIARGNLPVPSRFRYLFCSFTRNSLPPKTLEIESPLSAKHSWTISIPELGWFLIYEVTKVNNLIAYKLHFCGKLNLMVN